MNEPSGERVQKVLARVGIGSRRTCDELVAAGRVTVNGVVATPGRRIDPESDVVAVDGVPVPTRVDLVYYLLNKPAGVVTTADDPHRRPTVVDLVPRTPRVFPVGRLDADTEGLLLLTNDGDWAQRVAHPSHGVDKTYLAEVEGEPRASALRRLRGGVELDDGRTAPARVHVVQERPRVAIELTLHEGKNRQVRRMCAAVGHPVRRLVRTRIGPVADTSLAPGTWRRLELREIRALAGEAIERGPEET